MIKVNISRLTKMLTPTILRQPRMNAWLQSLTSPVAALYDRFVGARDHDIYRESIDSTVPRLEYMLNREFYSAGLDEDYAGRIRVQTTFSPVAVGLYLGGIASASNEGRPVFLADGIPVALYTTEELREVDYSFYVMVPEGIDYDEDRLRSLVSSYALPNQTFGIRQTTTIP